MIELHCTIEGRCVPWQRTASWQGRKLTPKAQREYQRRVKATVAAARPHGWDTGMRYAVGLTVYEPDARRRDVDNQAKTVLDALNGVLWADDSSVDVLVVARRLDRARPRVELTVSPMTLTERDSVTAQLVFR